MATIVFGFTTDVCDGQRAAGGCIETHGESREKMSYCEDYIDPFVDEADEYYEFEDEDNEDWECAYPGECLMGYADHLRCECYTVEDAEEMDGGV